ncbi:MAG: MotA/TolQ/ExbB proton channel family protein [Myxococcales bacterium FL481]|nr:MAG: MotA/TolQ/ExbB proton channel family protein [Myxococcales bacterium FL481]
MDLSLVEIWETMGFLARLVAIVLIGMGVATAVVGIERWLILNTGLSRSAQFLARARPLLDDAELAKVKDLSAGKEYGKAPLARLIRTGITVYEKHEGKAGGLDLTRRDLERQLDSIAAESRRGMSLLASIGSTAPFIGLFGTVIGIITAFQGIAASGGGGLDAVSAGIAEALIVTAVGLVVAIVAVLVFNYLSARFDELDMKMQHAAGELLDHMELSRGG